MYVSVSIAVMIVVLSQFVFCVTYILMTSLSHSSWSLLEVCPTTVTLSSEEDKLMGWCWVHGTVLDKSLLNASVVITKDCLCYGAAEREHWFVMNICCR